MSLLVVFAIAFTAWLMWPSRVSPAYWDEPQQPEMTGPLEPNNRLAQAQILGRGDLERLEDVAIASNDDLYLSCSCGQLQRLQRDPETGDWSASVHMAVADFAIMGLDWLNEEELIAGGNDGVHLANIRTLEARKLNTGSPSRPLGFVNDVLVAPDGTIYFTDSTAGWILPNNQVDPDFRALEVLEGRPHGFLYSVDPASGQVRLVLERLYYPNGLETSTDEQSLFIAESSRYRILRHALSGPNAGETVVFADNLPGAPDGMESDGRGRLFVTIVRSRHEVVRFLRRHPFLARLAEKVGYRPNLFRPNARPIVVVFNEYTGEIIDSFQGGTDELTSFSHAVPTEDGTLWLSSDGEDFVARLELPASYREPVQ